MIRLKFIFKKYTHLMQFKPKNHLLQAALNFKLPNKQVITKRTCTCMHQVREAKLICELQATA